MFGVTMMPGQAAYTPAEWAAFQSLMTDAMDAEVTEQNEVEESRYRVPMSLVNPRVDVDDLLD